LAESYLAESREGLAVVELDLLAWKKARRSTMS